MIKKIAVLFCLFALVVQDFSAQTNKEIAGVYLRRSQESLKNSNIKSSKQNFDKAMKYLDSIGTSDMAKLGMELHFRLKKYNKAKTFSKKYFELVEDRESEEFLRLLEMSVDIDLGIEAKIEEEKRIAAEKLRKEKDLKRIDSLKNIWTAKANSLTLKVDSIYAFNKNNVAVFKKDNFVGLINDFGEVLLKADSFKDFISFDGFIIFKNKTNNPTKLYCYNSANKSGFLLPSIKIFNTLSTNFGTLMLPRANGRFVTYPNNSNQPFVFDLNLKKVVKVTDKQELFKNLKKEDIIDKYNKDDELKINKIWYKFGGNLGSEIYPLYDLETKKLLAYFFSVNKLLIPITDDFQFLGPVYNNVLQVKEANKISWISKNGAKVLDAKDKAALYLGNSIIKKLENNTYQIINDGVIVLGDEKLESMPEFLRKFSKKE